MKVPDLRPLIRQLMTEALKDANVVTRDELPALIQKMFGVKDGAKTETSITTADTQVTTPVVSEKRRTRRSSTPLESVEDLKAQLKGVKSNTPEYSRIYQRLNRARKLENASTPITTPARFQAAQKKALEQAEAAADAMEDETFEEPVKTTKNGKQDVTFVPDISADV